MPDRKNPFNHPVEPRSPPKSRLSLAAEPTPQFLSSGSAAWSAGASPNLAFVGYSDRLLAPFLLTKDLGREVVDLCPGIPPGVRGEPRLQAGMSKEFVPTPSLFDRDLGQEEPLVLS